MSATRIFDAHCHILTLDYLLTEVKNLQLMPGPKTLPAIAAGVKLPFIRQKIEDAIIKFREWLHQLSTALKFTDSQDAYNFLIAHEEKGWKTDGISTIVLMMDIYYMFQSPLCSGCGPKTLPVFDPIEWSTGFKEQYEQLSALQVQYPAKIFPFWAVDPRRPGSISFMKQNVSAQGPFYGVKLYPILGYHPQCNPLSHVYEFCNEHNLPIITHASPFGFSPYVPYYSDFGNPKHFIKILQKYPRLKINFAHCGYTMLTCKWKNWAGTILKMMDKYSDRDSPRVFSDLSCYTTENIYHKFLQILEKIDGKNYLHRLENNFMFGSDYDVMYFTRIITLEDYIQYFTEFASSLSGKLIERMTLTTPQRFLGI